MADALTVPDSAPAARTGRTSETMAWFASEVKQLLLIAGPMIFVSIFSMGIQLASVIFVGHLNDDLSLSRSSIAISFTNVVGFSVMIGMATALDTLCGQAYGAKKYGLMGLYLQRSLVVLNLAAIPIGLVFAYVADILRWLKQDPDIAVGTGQYTQCLIPSLFAVATTQSFTRFLLAQSLVIPILLCGLATLAVHLPLCWFLVYRSSLHFLGAAVAISISNWINALLLALYIGLSKDCETTCPRLSWEAFRDLKTFVLLAIPSTAMICVNIVALHMQIPFGIGGAISTRVSNELGAGNAKSARDVIKFGLSLSLSITMPLSIILLGIHKMVGQLFTDDEAVILYVSKITPMLSLSIFLDSTQMTLSGVARGCGFQVYGAFINLGSYYLVGLPIGCIVAFMTSLRVQGLWLATLCAPFVQVICLSALVARIDWDKEVNKAASRMNAYRE